MYRLIFIAIIVVATTVWAQQPAAENEAAAEPETATEPETEAVEGLSEEELEDLDIDSQADHTEEDEDVFKPTDAVSYQQSVAFPVDI